MTRSRSSVSKKQVAWEWSAAEDRDLLEACTRFGGQWQEVEKFVGRSRVDCMERWEVIMPLDWKSFSMLSWPDEDILRLMQAVRSNQYDNEKKCFVSTKQCDWSVVATLLNIDDWRWDPADCEHVWGELQSMKASRLGDFSELEDEILAERVVGWGRDQRGLWRWLSDALKRDHAVLRSRWNVIKKDYNNFESSHQRSSEGSCLYGSALLSSLGPAEQEGHSEACNSLWSSPVAYNPGSQSQLTALPGFTPSEAFSQHMNSDSSAEDIKDVSTMSCSRMLDTSFDSARSAPASGRSSKSSRLIDLSFFSSRSFSDHDADVSPTARRVRQKILPSLKYWSSSESEDCTYVKNPSTRQSAEPVVGPVQDSVVELEKGCSVEQARGSNTDNSRWYEVIDLSHEDTAALEEDLIQIACQESVSQQSSLPTRSQSTQHNVRSTTKDANTSTDGTSTVHSLRDPHVPENIPKEVLLSEQETPEEEILLALFNSMSEDPTEDTIDITTGLPAELTIPNLPSPSSNANPSYTPFAFDTNSSDHANIAGRSLYGGVSGFGTVSTLGAAGSDASHGINNNGAPASSSVFAMTGTSADIRATRNTLSSDEAAVTVADTTGLKHISSGIASNAPTQSSDCSAAATVSMNARQEQTTARSSLFNPGGPFQFVCGTSSAKGCGSTSVTCPPVRCPPAVPNSLFRRSATVPISFNTTSTTTTLTTTSTTVCMPASTTASATITAPTATPTTSTSAYTEPVHSTATSSTAPAHHTCGNFNHYSYESYCDGPSTSSAALEEKVDDSTYTEQVLVDLAKQSSEREAQDLDEALQLSLQTSQSSSHHSENISHRGASNNSTSSNSNINHSDHSSRNISYNGGSVPIAPAPSLAFVPDHVIHPFRTEEELIQLALDASLQDSDHTVPVPTSSTTLPTNHDNDAYKTTMTTTISGSSQHDIHATNDGNNYSRLPVSSASDAPADRLTNFDAPYVNFATGSDNYWEDNDEEELMRAIERSLHET